MKKVLIFTLCACIAMMVVSCVEPLNNDLPSKGVGRVSLKLSVNCVMPASKATATGVDTLNENKITTVDWFVFTATGDNAEAVEHGRKTYTDKNNVTSAFGVDTLDMRQYVNPTTKTVSGRVYVIANLPAAYTHTADGIQYNSGSVSSTIGTKLGDLKKLEVVTTFDVLGTDGKTKKQDSFVMASDVVSFSLTDEARQQEVVAQLSRVAAKITLDLSVISAIDEVTAQMAGRDTMYEQYVRTWYPDVNNIQVYLSYANSQTTLDRTLYGTAPYSYDDDTFFTYDRGGFKSKVQSTADGWQITGSPFYSYPMTWTMVAEHAPFIKIILPWRAYQETPTYETYHYILHEVDPASGQPTTREGNKLKSATRTHINDVTASPEDFYYKISIPADNNVLESNTWYNIALDVAILGGRSDDLIMEVAGKYYVLDWSDPDFTAGGALVQGSYLKLGDDTYYIYGEDSITIPVLSSHDVTATVTSARYTDFSGDNPVEKTLSSTSYTTNGFGRDSIKLTHVLDRDITSRNLDCSVITFNVRVSNGAGLSKNITVIQQPPLYIEVEDSNKYVYVNGTSNRATGYGDYWRVYETGYNYNNSSLSNRLGTIRYHSYTTSGNNNFHIYTVHVSSLVGTDWILADPRSKTGVSYPNLKGTSTSGASLTNYKRTDPNASNQVAPALKVASSAGASLSSSNNNYGRVIFENAHKRCAAYQENGYPAGRWRVPTEAEIKFFINLSKNTKLPPLFNGRYWAANGKIISSSGEYDEGESEGGQTVAAVRCVYDAWYWGNTPVNAYKTTWSGWQN